MLPAEGRLGVMEQCCTGGPASRRLARRLCVAVASVLPGAWLLLLPKCPFCLAVWLTVATGTSFTATGATWVYWSVIVLWATSVVFAFTQRADLQPGKGQTRSTVLLSIQLLSSSLRNFISSRTTRRV